MQWLDGMSSCESTDRSRDWGGSGASLAQGAMLGQWRRGSSLGFCRQRELRLKDTGMPGRNEGGRLRRLPGLALADIPHANLEDWGIGGI